MWTIIKKELHSFFSTPTGYIVTILFLLGTALFLWVLPGEYNILDSGYANLDGLFALAPWLFLFLCPAITMRMIAEERQTGTIETLMVKPLTVWRIVAGKWIASWLLVLIALLPTILWYIIVGLIAEPPFNIDSGAFWGSWIGLVLLAMVYCAIGLFGSSLTSSQIVAFIASTIICFLTYYGFELIGSLTSGSTAYTLRTLGIDAHYTSMARGVIDSRDIVYYLLVAALFVSAAVSMTRKK